jgi:hypothetical protein
MDVLEATIIDGLVIKAKIRPGEKTVTENEITNIQHGGTIYARKGLLEVPFPHAIITQRMDIIQTQYGMIRRRRKASEYRKIVVSDLPILC